MNMKKSSLISLLSLAVTWAAPALAQTPPMCTVFDTLRNQNGVAISGAKVIVSNVIKSGGELYLLSPKSYLSNAAGIVSFALPRDAQANIEAYFGQFNVPGGRQVLIPDAASVLLRQLQPGSITVSTNAGFIRIREDDGSPSYAITGNNDTLEVTASALSNPSSNVFRITLPSAFDDFSDIDLTGAGAGDLIMRRASGVWVDTTTVPRSMLAAGNAHRIVINDGLGALSETSALSDGQLLIGSTGAAPAVASLTGTSGEITVTPGAGSITVSVPDVYDIRELPAGFFNPGAGDLTGATALADDADNTNDFTIDQLEFAADAENYISATISMPPDWDGSTAPKFKIIYYSGTGHASNTVEWDIATGWIRPGTDSWIAALGSAVSTNHNPTTANVWYITDALSPTPAGTAAAGAQIKIRIFRDGDDATNDTHTATARLVKVLIQYKKTVYGETTSW